MWIPNVLFWLRSGCSVCTTQLDIKSEFSATIPVVPKEFFLHGIKNNTAYGGLNSIGNWTQEWESTRNSSAEKAGNVWSKFALMRSIQPRPVLELNKYLLHFQVHNTAIFLEFYHHYTKLKKRKGNKPKRLKCGSYPASLATSWSDGNNKWAVNKNILKYNTLVLNITFKEFSPKDAISFHKYFQTL